MPAPIHDGNGALDGAIMGAVQNCARKALGMPLQRHSADCAAHRMRIQAERQVFRARQNDVIHERFQIVYVIRKMIDVRQPRFLN